MVNWYRRWEQSQALVVLPVVLVLAGAAGLVLGADVARSFGNLGGPLAVRITGFFLLTGGLATLAGLKFHYPLSAISGLAVGALGAALYGVGTLIGFGLGGFMSGIGWIGISVILLERVWFSLSRSRARRRIERGQ
jgi:hypothetical protein